jgi:hypothetical protein
LSRDRLRELLSHDDRRSIARANDVVNAVLAGRARVDDLAALTMDEESWLVSARALDALEKLAHKQPELVRPHRKVFLDLAASDKWEIRLQVVRAIPLLGWNHREMKRATAVLRDNLDHPQAFVRAWALDSLAILSGHDSSLRTLVERRLDEFARSPSKAVQARARHIRARLGRAARTTSKVSVPEQSRGRGRTRVARTR